MKVSLVYSPAPRQTREWTFEVPSGSDVKHAVLECGVLGISGEFSEFAGLAPEVLKLGIWGKPCSISHKLAENDRIEIYRLLRVDPKVARRERFGNQGAKRAGLFSNKRAGAKAGYGG